MLGKLFKHDMAAVSRYLLPLHGVLILLTLVGRLLVSVTKTTALPRYVSTTCLIIYVLYIIFVACATIIYLISYFYKTMYGLEGYLTFTLPAKPWQLLASKTISAVLWELIDGVLVVLSIITLVMTKEVWNSAVNDFSYVFSRFQETYGYGLGTGIILPMVFCALASLTQGMLFFYLCLSIGQLSNKHRVAIAVGAFFGINIILQIISTTMVFSILPNNSYFYSQSGIDQFASLPRFLWTGFGVSVLLCVVFWLLNNYIMNRKLNLL